MSTALSTIVRWSGFLLLTNASMGVFAASTDFTSEKKLPFLMVHGANGTNCTNTGWITPTAATVNLPAESMTLTGTSVTVDATCNPSYFSLSKDRAISRMVQTQPAQFEAMLKQPYVIGIKFHILSVAKLNVTATVDVTDLIDVYDMIDMYVAKAHSIFEPMGVGLLVSVNNHVNDEVQQSGVQAAIDQIPSVLGGTLLPNTLLNSLRNLSDDSYARGLINVYIFNGSEITTSTVVASQFRAFYAENGPYSSDDFIVINWDLAPNSTFAHELGHALSLEHVNFISTDGTMYCYAYGAIDGICDYGPANLMWINQPSVVRNFLTPPQVLRTVFNETSFINREDRIGGKPFTTFNCPDWAITRDCPFLGATPP